jgi:uncharacterized membrane protein YjjB (DUF3815 family)
MSGASNALSTTTGCASLHIECATLPGRHLLHRGRQPVITISLLAGIGTLLPGIHIRTVDASRTLLGSSQVTTHHAVLHYAMLCDVMRFDALYLALALSMYIHTSPTTRPRCCGWQDTIPW